MRIFRQVHRWLGLIVGLQVLMWVAGGVYMSAMPLDLVHGKHLIHQAVTQTDHAPEWSQSTNVHRSQLPLMLDITRFDSVAWTHSAVRTLVKTTDKAGGANSIHYFVVEQGNLKPASPLSEQNIAFAARARFSGTADIDSIAYLPVPPAEASGLTEPVYQVVFDDWSHATFYLHPMTGEVLKVRSDIWRLFDIFWMLHIMDYDERSDFNNPLLIIFAIVTLFFTASGLALVLHWLRHRWFRQRRSTG
ncbi:PepSY domain-containing protein [Alteromonas oceanisediminis]|uniref:PepSY domain-containing protein n=1 Tax=Alteromonas oceanisediminis TaxID=2836180 RepID=UPI001BDAD0E6|nr:PepSY domain-containing protein [Alteromonas oceanisediminis]MBT0585552.1 PepSY domain-containing protein [Alteromonas oceanisediminis]